MYSFAGLLRAERVSAAAEGIAIEDAPNPSVSAKVFNFAEPALSPKLNRKWACSLVRWTTLHDTRTSLGFAFLSACGQSKVVSYVSQGAYARFVAFSRNWHS